MVRLPNVEYKLYHDFPLNNYKINQSGITQKNV